MSAVNARMGKTVFKNLKAARRGLNVKESQDKEAFFRLVDQTFARQNRSNPINKETAGRIIDHTLKNGHGKILAAYDTDGNAHSAGFFVYDEKTCYYLMGGQDPAFKSDGSQNLVLFEAIQFAATVSENFDFEGSMVEGIENFFRQFGGNQVTNYHVAKTTLISELIDVSKPHVKRLLGYKI